jgi:hypothetical protein
VDEPGADDQVGPGPLDSPARLLTIVIDVPQGDIDHDHGLGGHRSLQELTTPWGSGAVSRAWPPVMRVAMR